MNSKLVPAYEFYIMGKKHKGVFILFPFMLISTNKSVNYVGHASDILIQ